MDFIGVSERMCVRMKKGKKKNIIPNVVQMSLVCIVSIKSVGGKYEIYEHIFSISGLRKTHCLHAEYISINDRFASIDAYEKRTNHHR